MSNHVEPGTTLGLPAIKAQAPATPEKPSKGFVFVLFGFVGGYFAFTWSFCPPLFWIVAIGTGIGLLNKLLSAGTDNREYNCGAGGPDL